MGRRSKAKKMAKRKNVVHQVQATLEQNVFASGDDANPSSQMTKTTYSFTSMKGSQVLSTKSTTVTTTHTFQTNENDDEKTGANVEKIVSNRNSGDSSGIGSVVNTPVASPPLLLPQFETKKSTSSYDEEGKNHHLCSCDHCGGTWSSDDMSSSNESDFDEEELRVNNRMSVLMLSNAKAKKILESNKYYNKILTTQKFIREQQLRVLQRANYVNSMFVKNMDVIMRLGICPLMLQSRTDALSQGLLDSHRMIQNWDETLESLLPVPKSKTDKKIILPSLLNVFRERYGTNIEVMSDEEFEEALRNSMNEIPELMPDEESSKAAFEEMDMRKVEQEWEIFEQHVEGRILALEIELIELCVEYGVRANLPKVAGYEWAISKK